MGKRSEALAARLEAGAAALASFASTLTEAELQTCVPHDGRKHAVRHSYHHLGGIRAALGL